MENRKKRESTSNYRPVETVAKMQVRAPLVSTDVQKPQHEVKHL